MKFDLQSRDKSVIEQLITWFTLSLSHYLVNAIECSKSSEINIAFMFSLI